MQFAVPFIRIPVEKAMDMTKGAVANFNVASLVVTGAIVVVTGFILPTILKFVDQKIMPIPIHTGFKRGKSSNRYLPSYYNIRRYFSFKPIYRN